MSKLKQFLKTLLLSALLGSTVVQAAEIKATVDWARKVDLRFPVSGIIKQVKVETGYKVKKNDVLISLDRRAFRANVQQHKAEVTARKSAYDEAVREQQRFQELYDRTMLSEHELQVAKNHVTETRSAWIKAKAALTRAYVELDHSQMKAHFNAIVLKKAAEVGQAVVLGEGQPALLTLAASDIRLARTTVTTGEVNAWKIGNKVQVKSGKYDLQGKVVAVNLNSPTQLDVVIEFESGDHAIMPGSTVTVMTP